MTDIVYITQGGYIEPGHRPLAEGLREAVRLTQRYDALLDRKRAWEAQLTPPKPPIPYKKPLKGFAKNLVMFIISLFLDMFILAPLALGICMFIMQPTSDQMMTMTGVTWGLVLLLGPVCFFVPKSLWNKHIAKKNAKIAQENRRIEKYNATPKQQDAHIYANIKDVQDQIDQVVYEFNTEIAPWYPSKQYGYSQAAAYFYEVVSDGTALDMGRAVELYENDKARRIQQQQMAEMVSAQKQAAREAKFQSMVGAMNLGANIANANNTERIADALTPRKRSKWL